MVAARSNVMSHGRIFRAERNERQPWPDFWRRNRPQGRRGHPTFGGALRASPRWCVGAGAISAVAIGSAPVGAPMQSPVCASVLLVAPERGGITDTLRAQAESGNCRRGSPRPPPGKDEISRAVGKRQTGTHCHFGGNSVRRRGGLAYGSGKFEKRRPLAQFRKII